MKDRVGGDSRLCLFTDGFYLFGYPVTYAFSGRTSSDQV